MTDLTRDEVNRFIHEKIMGKCWHRWPSGRREWCCRAMKTALHVDNKLALIDQNPDYCSDDSPRSLLNEVVAVVLNKCGRDAYDDALEGVLRKTLRVVRQPLSPLAAHALADQLAEKVVLMSINPTAEQIARACVEAWEAREG